MKDLMVLDSKYTQTTRFLRVSLLMVKSMDGDAESLLKVKCTKGLSSTTKCMARGCFSGPTEDYSMVCFKLAERMAKVLTIGQAVKFMLANLKMTSALARVYFTIQMARLSSAHGEKVKSTAKATMNGQITLNTILCTTTVANVKNLAS